MLNFPTLTVKAINASAAPSESTWSSTTACYSSTAFSSPGGMLGFLIQNGFAYVDELTIKSWDTATSAFDITEHYDNFTVDGSGYASETPTYDLAGNLTYDGIQQYTYDAWNRLISVAHAYRDSGGTLQHGQTFDAMRYDAKGRRLSKAVSNSGQWDCTYNYYYDHDRMIEERNGSNQTMKQHVWGLTYIDELVQVAANSNPTTGNICSDLFWAAQDANFNVLGLVNSSGALVERYEYAPYGQRKVLFAAGNSYSGNTSSYDPGCYAIAYASPRVTSNMPCFGLCEIGSQGLIHDEECGLVYNRARFLHTDLGRYASRDPLPLPNGLNPFEQLRSQPVDDHDSFGLVADSELQVVNPGAKEFAARYGLHALDSVDKQWSRGGNLDSNVQKWRLQHHRNDGTYETARIHGLFYLACRDSEHKYVGFKYEAQDTGERFFLDPNFAYTKVYRFDESLGHKFVVKSGDMSVPLTFQRSTGFGEAASDFLAFHMLDNTAGGTITVEPTLPKQYVKQELEWTAIVREGFGREPSEHIEVTATLKEFPNQPDPVKRTPGIIMIVPISDDGYGAYPPFDYQD